MKELKIKLSTIQDVKEFVNITNKYPFDCDLVSGRYAIDAKSIMGIFSLDLSRPLNMVIRSESTEDIMGEIAKFISK